MLVVAAVRVLKMSVRLAAKRVSCSLGTLRRPIAPAAIVIRRNAATAAASNLPEYLRHAIEVRASLQGIRLSTDG